MGSCDAPPSNLLLPAVLAALVLRPVRKERLEPPEPFDDLSGCAFNHRRECRIGLDPAAPRSDRATARRARRLDVRRTLPSAPRRFRGTASAGPPTRWRR